MQEITKREFTFHPSDDVYMNAIEFVFTVDSNKDTMDERWGPLIHYPSDQIPMLWTRVSSNDENTSFTFESRMVTYPIYLNLLFRLITKSFNFVCKDPDLLSKFKFGTDFDNRCDELWYEHVGLPKDTEVEVWVKSNFTRPSRIDQLYDLML